MSFRLPMFPLGTALVPHGVLPLHVFEARYRVLMFDCLRSDRRFGVVLIERGHEVGGGDQRFDIGTVARIEAAEELPDGRWIMVSVGVGRVRIVEWLADDPYPVAMVDDLPESPFPAREGRQALAVADRAVRRALAGAAGEFRVSPDPVVAGWQLLAVAPVSSLDRQRMLEVDDPLVRLHRLADAADECAALFGSDLDGE